VTGTQNTVAQVDNGNRVVLQPPACVGVVPHLMRASARSLAIDVLEGLEQAGVAARVPESAARRTGLEKWAVADDRFADGMDLAFSLGGDGTMLYTVDVVGAYGIPVLGVNVGHLGYLTAVRPGAAMARLGDVIAGNYLIEERMMLEVTVKATPTSVERHYRALNEAVLEKRSAGNLVRLNVAFNGTPFTEYAADGFIVATPTGSTAYAFSARGPIVSPLMRSIVVVPVSPHMLFDRSLVLAPDETVRIEIGEGRPASLFVDGRDAGVLEEGGVVSLSEARVPARFVTFEQRDFHAILKTKFGLPDRLPEGI
jgi:NAD+ kinase